MVATKKTRVIMAKVGLDGHERGIWTVSSVLREAGMEVIYLGLHQTPESIVKAAIEEDADVVGLSCLCGEHLLSAPRIAELLKENAMSHIALLVGDIIPDEDIPLLKKSGVYEVFGPGSPSESIIKCIEVRAGTKKRKRRSQV